MRAPIRILFVCLGNICRSPLAESVFRHRAAERGVADRFELDSAGTSGYHDGDPPDARSVETARRRGMQVRGESRRLAATDFGRWDLVIGMDASNVAEIRRIASGMGGDPGRVHRLREWDPEPASGDVPDPYFGGEGGFERVQDIVERSVDALLDDLLSSAAPG